MELEPILNIVAYLPSLLMGTGETLCIALVSMAFGLFLGLLLSLGLLSKTPWLRSPVSMLCTLLQGLPEMLILLVVYFEIPRILSFIIGHTIELSPWTIGMSTLAVVGGTYAAKIFYGAFQNIHAGQRDAGMMLGLNASQTLRHILLPQVIQYALPGLSNLWLTLLKDTALLSLIGASDLMSRTKIAIGNTQKPFTFYVIAALIYLGLVTLSETLLKRGVRHA